ncbi:MAG: dTDP-4-dehydrorhamnose 3,5-epimerase [Acidimicrobiia bacterium]
MIRTPLEPKLIYPDLLEDARGHFAEVYNKREFDRLVGHEFTFVQDNQSRSRKGVLRGLHYQLEPHAQGKLIRVTHGEIFDVAVDIRRSSPSFGSWVGHHLSNENQAHLWVPPGFAHGFLVLSEVADVIYKVTKYHSAPDARTIHWADPAIGVVWPLDGKVPITSDRDHSAPSLEETEVFN